MNWQWMTKPARKLDQMTIDALQVAYLWLLDRTGIYVGTVGLVTFAASVVCIDWAGWPVILIAIVGLIGVINLLLLGFRYHLQGSGNCKVFNALAQNYISDINFRAFFNIQLVLFLMLNLLRLDGRGIAFEVLALIYNFIPCIMIRDREKKPFFGFGDKTVMEGT